MRISDLSSDVCSSDLLQPRIAFSDYVNHHRYLPADLSCINSGANMGTTAIIFLVILAITILYGIGSSEESRVGKECFSSCRSWWSPSHLTTNIFLFSFLSLFFLFFNLFSFSFF